MKKIIRLTESELRNLVSNSVKRIIKEGGYTNRGFVPHDGNGMVGGAWGSKHTTGSKNVLNELLEGIDINPEEYEQFEQYCLQNEDVFTLTANISVSFDESTGYGSQMFPMYEIDDINGVDEAIQYVSHYPNQDTAQVAVQTLNSIVDGLDASDFDIDEDDDEY